MVTKNNPGGGQHPENTGAPFKPVQVTNGLNGSLCPLIYSCIGKEFVLFPYLGQPCFLFLSHKIVYRTILETNPKSFSLAPSLLKLFCFGLVPAGSENPGDNHGCLGLTRPAYNVKIVLEQRKFLLPNMIMTAIQQTMKCIYSSDWWS